MSTSLVTPSAKSHERVTGRWGQDLKATTRNDWAVYYTKLVFGSPVPYLLLLLVFSLALNSLVSEISSWLIVFLTFIYIVSDLRVSQREFRFFPLGADIPLFAFTFFAVLSLILNGQQIINFGPFCFIQWIPLAYLFAYALELFPGLNRLFLILFVAIGIGCVVALIQHFVGVDFITSQPMEPAPGRDIPFFTIRGLFSSPEVFATIIATLLPLPVSIFLSTDQRDSVRVQVFSLVCLAIGIICLLWTYRIEMWIVAASGIIISMILHKKRQIWLITYVAVVVSILLVLFYSSPNQFFDQVKAARDARATLNRVEINKDLKVFMDNMWIGVGPRSGLGSVTPESNLLSANSSPVSQSSADQIVASHASDSFTVTNELGTNLYFKLLAETGALGLVTYFGFLLSFLMVTYRLWQEIPESHFWHRILSAGLLAGQICFHVSGLYWATLYNTQASILFALILACIGYVRSHYSRGLVPDDYAL